MSAHNGGSGPRSNSYSENRFTNWSEYKPWWLEVQAVFKRFDGKIAKRPTFPKDRWNTTRKERERFAERFAQDHG